MPRFLRFLQHVQGHDHRRTGVDEVLRQEKIALQMDGVDYVHDHVGCAEQYVPGYPLVIAEGADAIAPRCVDEAPVIETAHHDADRGAGIVRYLGVTARERAKSTDLPTFGLPISAIVPRAPCAGTSESVWLQQSPLYFLNRRSAVVLMTRTSSAYLSPNPVRPSDAPECNWRQGGRWLAHKYRNGLLRARSASSGCIRDVSQPEAPGARIGS